jgi:hypothetical protein
MKSKPLPSQEDLATHFTYADGELMWKLNPAQHKRTTCGYKNKRGYVEVRFKSKLYLRHRLIWKLIYGTEPEVINHLNGIAGDDRIENLESCSQRSNIQQGRNVSQRKHQLPLGVHKTPSGKFYATAVLKGKSTCVGSFHTPEEAHQAYCQAVGGV